MLQPAFFLLLSASQPLAHRGLGGTRSAARGGGAEPPPRSTTLSAQFDRALLLQRAGDVDGALVECVALASASACVCRGRLRESESDARERAARYVDLSRDSVEGRRRLSSSSFIASDPFALRSATTAMRRYQTFLDAAAECDVDARRYAEARKEERAPARFSRSRFPRFGSRAASRG